jgi:hypothetical protein
VLAVLDRLPVISTNWREPTRVQPAAGAEKGASSEGTFCLEVSLQRGAGQGGRQSAPRVYAPHFPKVSRGRPWFGHPKIRPAGRLAGCGCGGASAGGACGRPCNNPNPGAPAHLRSCLQVKEEGWWLLLGSFATGELHAVKRTSFGNRATVR